MCGPGFEEKSDIWQENDALSYEFSREKHKKNLIKKDGSLPLTH